tara:strand:- start:2570 stop:3103 length:534 start_codon:yes stop_codon:yes gene_type:complete
MGKKLSRNQIRNIILKEIESIGEDVIVTKQDSIERPTPPLKHSKMRCEQCGGRTYEGKCINCGSEQLVPNGKSVNEGSECSACSKSNLVDADFDFIPDFMEDDYATPGEALGSHHKSGAYMAKKQMYKVSKYAEKIYQMIPDGYDLEDWMRTKLSQIADDIGEVYHALDHDAFEGDL